MISYIELFKPDYLFGIPSLLVDLSDSLKDLNIKIKGIFYAGERFSSNQKLQIEKNIGCNRFISAGYASVDVGPIGYQDQTCLEDEHILFDGLKLEVINNEAVVSSSIRKMMPVLRYRTGDRVKLTSFSDQVRFKLLGRVDQMIFIFGTRIGFIQIKENITNILGENSDFQLVITNSDGHDNLEIRLNRTIDPIRLIKEIWTNIADINQTLDFESFSKLVRVQNKKLILNERTGKCLEIIDKRF